MSKARLVVTAVVVEGRTHAEVAAGYGLSRSWVTRYRAEGPAAFEPRSRRPRTSPAAASDEVVELAVNLRSELDGQRLDAGPHTICRHLHQRHQIDVSASTIRRRLVDTGLVEPNPKKRPKSSYTRFAADLPNETWQSDFTHWPLSDGSTTEIITWLDDHSCYALSVTANRPSAGPGRQIESKTKRSDFYPSQTGPALSHHYPHRCSYVLTHPLHMPLSFPPCRNGRSRL